MRTKISASIMGYWIILAILFGAAAYFIFFKGNCNTNHGSANIYPEKSIAVLPFTTTISDSSQQYLSDGLTDDILNSLSQLKGVKVTAPASSFQFRGAGMDIKNAGKKLNVSTVLHGSFQLTESNIRIVVTLANAEDGSNIWTQQFEDDIDDIFNLKNKIAVAIAERLQIGVEQNERQIKTQENSLNKNAYEFYLKGRLAWNLRTPVSLKNGIDFFQQAISLDSLYAGAYAGLADCYTALGYGSFLAPKEAFLKSFTAASKAIALDSTLAEPHATLGYYRFYYDWDWLAAEQEFRIAISLNSNYAIAYDWYGYYLTAMERYDEAKTILGKAAELDPLSVPIKTDIGFSTYYSGQYDSAVKELTAALQINPNFPLARLWAGRCYQAQKMYPEAIGEFQKAIKATSAWPVAYAQIGSVYGVAGDRREALKILDTLSALSKNKYVTSYGVALVYAGLGDTDETFNWLNKAYDERTHWLVWLKSDPRWISIRPDKRFVELVNKVGLPQ